MCSTDRELRDGTNQSLIACRPLRFNMTGILQVLIPSAVVSILTIMVGSKPALAINLAIDGKKSMPEIWDLLPLVFLVGLSLTLGFILQGKVRYRYIARGFYIGAPVPSVFTATSRPHAS